MRPSPSATAEKESFAPRKVLSRVGGQQEGAASLVAKSVVESASLNDLKKTESSFLYTKFSPSAGC